MKPTFDEIVSATLEAANINKKVFEDAGKSRFAPIVKARQMICYIAKEVGYSSVYIEQQMKIDHSSINYHVRQARERFCLENDYALIVDKAMAKLGFHSKHHSILGWITRDKEEDGGYLYLTIGKKPKRVQDMWYVRDGMMIDLPKEAFPQITWDSAPKKCEMTLRLK